MGYTLEQPTQPEEGTEPQAEEQPAAPAADDAGAEDTEEQQIVPAAAAEAVSAEAMDTVIASGDCGGDAHWTLDSDGLLTVTGTGEIDDSGSWVKNSVKSLVIEDSLTAIGNNAFEGCTSLQSVTLPESLTSIGESAFSYCEALESVTIPAGVTVIESFVFFVCTSLQSVTLPDSLTAIRNNAFEGCTSLQSVTIPAGVTVIDRFVFSSCTALQSVKLPAGLTGIGSYAFENCYALESVMLPDSLTAIEGCAFDYCGSLKSITLPDSLQSIGVNAFHGCIALESVTIPAGVTAIGDSPFGDCTSLTGFTVAAGNEYFSAVGPALMSHDGTRLIQCATGYTGVWEAPAGLTRIGNSAFQACAGLTALTLPESVTEVGTYAFSECGLTQLTLTGDCPAFGDRAFWQVNATVYYPADASGYTEATMLDYGGNVTWESYMPTVDSGDCGDDAHWTQYSNGLLTITGTGEIDDSGSWDKDSIKSLVIENGITEIGRDAFYGCTALQSVTLPDSLTSIGFNAFFACTVLESVTIPAGVTAIGESPFGDCKKLTGFTVAPGNGCFSSVGPALMSYDGTRLIQCAAGYTGIWEVPAGVTRIENFAFEHCVGLTALTLPASVTEVGTYAFSYCGMTQLTLTGDCPSFEDRSFWKVNVTVFYPAEASGYTEATMQNYGGTVTWVSVSPPSITTQPAAQNVAAGSTATFRVAATGTGLSYQWYCRANSSAEWSAVSGATSAAYQLTATAAQNGYQYQCKVWNAYGTVYSNAVTLTVKTAPAKPVITTQPIAQTVAVKKTATFKVSASGTGLSYQWYYRTSSTGSWKAIKGGTSKTCKFTTAAKQNNYQFRCKVSNAGGTVYTKAVKLTVVTAKPGIKTQPADRKMAAKKTATFKVVATGRALHYQWYRLKPGGKWEKISGATSATYKVTAKKTLNGYKFRCKVTNVMGSVTSKAVKLTVK